jgi:hypothetical protein
MSNLPLFVSGGSLAISFGTLIYLNNQITENTSKLEKYSDTLKDVIKEVIKIPDIEVRIEAFRQVLNKMHNNNSELLNNQKQNSEKMAQVFKKLSTHIQDLIERDEERDIEMAAMSKQLDSLTKAAKLKGWNVKSETLGSERNHSDRRRIDRYPSLENMDSSFSKHTPRDRDTSVKSVRWDDSESSNYTDSLRTDSIYQPPRFRSSGRQTSNTRRAELIRHLREEDLSDTRSYDRGEDTVHRASHDKSRRVQPRHQPSRHTRRDEILDEQELNLDLNEEVSDDYSDEDTNTRAVSRNSSMSVDGDMDLTL